MDALAQLFSLDEVRSLALGLVAIMARLAGAMWMVPFAGGRKVPAVVRLSLALALSLAILPGVSSQLSALNRMDDQLLWAILIKEALLGLCLGFVLALAFWSIRSAGRLMEASRGSTRPGGGSSLEEDWPLADLLALFAVVLFLLLGGHRIYILALARSFETIPLAAMPSVESFGMFARLCMVLGGELFLLAFVLAAPVLASVFLADMTIGWISRPPAGASLGAMLQPMRALLGVGAVLVTVAVLAETIPGVLEAALGQVDRAVNIFGSGVGR